MLLLFYRQHAISVFKNNNMISQVSPVTFPVKWTKIVDFAKNPVFRRQMAKMEF